MHSAILQVIQNCKFFSTVYCLVSILLRCLTPFLLIFLSSPSYRCNMPIYFNFTTFPLPRHMLITNSPTTSSTVLCTEMFPCAKVSFRCLTIPSTYFKPCLLFSVPQCSASTYNFLSLFSSSSDCALPSLNLLSSCGIQINFMPFFTTFYHIFQFILPLLTFLFIPNHCQ